MGKQAYEYIEMVYARNDIGIYSINVTGKIGYLTICSTLKNQLLMEENFNIKKQYLKYSKQYG